MQESFLDEVKRYVGFGPADERALVELRPFLEAHAGPVVDRFYERILEHPRAGKAITGGTAQVERLKATLRRWLVELGGGVYDADYFARRAAIGKRHVVITLPQVFMVTAVNGVRLDLIGFLRQKVSDRGELERYADALQKILDIDLAIMLETYRDDYVEKIVRSERRAAIGDLGAKVNHELRQRLGLVKTSAHLLEKQLGDSAPESVKKHLAKIQHGAHAATTIVASLLNLARELKPNVIALDLNHLVREAAAAVPHSGRVQVVLDLAPGSPQIRGDAELMGSVIGHLVRNAIESHDGRDGTVRVRTSVENGTTWLRVTDEGPGLSPEILPSLFQPFFTTKPGAAGLGLAIAKDIVSAHGGEISGRSNPAGKGAEFAVALRS